MKQTVSVLVKGIHKTPEGEDVIETRAQGSYQELSGNHFLTYEETDAESGVVTKHLVKFTDHLLEVVKKGRTNVTMTFDPRKTTLCDYETPYGLLPMEIETEFVHMTTKDKQLRFYSKYRLLMDGAPLSEGASTICIDVMF